VRGVRKTLSRLAASESYPASVALRCAKYVLPLAVANLRFQQGRLTEAYACAKRARHAGLTDRIEFMLAELHSPVVTIDYPAVPKGEFNGRVLQVLHSSMPMDANGYAMRSEHILSALAELGVVQSAITRLGYPWDLSRHAGFDRTALSTRSQRWAYQHRALEPQPDPVSIGGREDRYLSAYADWVEDMARKQKAGVIHAHSNYLNGLAAVEAARRLDLAVIYEMRGLWHLTRATREHDYSASEHYRFCELRELQAARSAHRVIAISGELARWLIDRGIDPGKITVVANASSEVSDSLSPTEAVRSKQPTVGYIGAFVEYEGLDLLLDAVADLVRTKPALKVILVGDGPCYPQLCEQIERLGLTEIVELPGRVEPDAVASYYQRLDVAVVPRRSNAITELIPPLKPMEIMAHGVPCVTTELAPLITMFRNREQAILTPTNDAQALSQAIACVLDDRQLATQLRNGGLAWAKKNSWKKNAQLYSQVYERAYEQASESR